jgi:hypothetical protein
MSWEEKTNPFFFFFFFLFCCLSSKINTKKVVPVPQAINKQKKGKQHSTVYKVRSVFECVLTITRDGQKAGLLDELHRIFLDDDIVSKLKSKSKKKKKQIGFAHCGKYNSSYAEQSADTL